MFWTKCLSIAAFFGALGVGLGAFGAHALKARLSEYGLGVFELASRYHMYHVFALLSLALVATKIENLAIKISFACFSIGILVFCGSLYALAITENRSLGMITPIGGVFFILGWLSLALSPMF